MVSIGKKAARAATENRELLEIVDLLRLRLANGMTLHVGTAAALRRWKRRLDRRVKAEMIRATVDMAHEHGHAKIMETRAAGDETAFQVAARLLKVSDEQARKVYYAGRKKLPRPKK